MSVAVNAVVAGLAVFIIVAGSIWFITVDRQRDRIQVTDIHHEWMGTVGKSERIGVDATFRNRYGVEATLQGWRYELQIQNIRVAQAESTQELKIPPNGVEEAHLNLDVPTDFVGAWVRSHMNGDETTEARFVGEAVFLVSNRNTTVSFGPQVEWKTDLRGALEQIENCPQPEPEPCVRDTNARWETEGDATVLRLVLDIRNPNDDPLVLGARSAELVWGGVPVGRADADGDVTVAPHESESVEFRVFLAFELLKDWWGGHVDRCESSPTMLRILLPYRLESSEPTPTSEPPTTTHPSSSASPSSSGSGSASTSPSSSTKATKTPRPMSILELVTPLFVDPVLRLAPAPGETGDVSWEFPGPLLRTELVCPAS
jgi:LEA14-like dessication related protein